MPRDRDPPLQLLLHHFPCSTHSGTQAVWRALQSAYAKGQARAIGVSNFAKADIDAVLALGGVGPSVNQCQMSVGSHDDETIAYGKAHNITYEACSVAASQRAWPKHPTPRVPLPWRERS